ncbi:hypothetical protein ABZP36_004459 [Zizania latifolia]
MPLARTALYGKGLQIYCAPTTDDLELWQVSITYKRKAQRGCFVLSANQFCRKKAYPPPPDDKFAGFDEEPSLDSVVCRGGSVIVLAGPNYNGEGLVTAGLDFGEIVRAKFDFDVVGRSSRPEVLTRAGFPAGPVPIQVFVGG